MNDVKRGSTNLEAQKSTWNGFAGFEWSQRGPKSDPFLGLAPHSGQLPAAPTEPTRAFSSIELPFRYVFRSRVQKGLKIELPKTTLAKKQRHFTRSFHPLFLNSKPTKLLPLCMAPVRSVKQRVMVIGGWGFFRFFLVSRFGILVSRPLFYSKTLVGDRA